MRGGGVVSPLARSGTIPASLCRDHEIFWVWEQCFRNQLLVHVRAVGIRRVDKIHTELHRPTQNRNCLSTIFRRTPNTLSCKAHRPKAEAVNGKLSAE